MLAERVRTPVGEVDLVARRGKLLAFIEVKARASIAAAHRSLDLQRLQRVAAAAEFLVPRFLDNAEDVRIDVIHIVPGYPPHHLEDVWQG